MILHVGMAPKLQRNEMLRDERFGSGMSAKRNYRRVFLGGGERGAIESEVRAQPRAVSN
jgi:hypothetical protein